MKSREPLIRAKKFQIDDLNRRISQIEGMIADFQRMAADLDRDIAAEEQRSGISDPRHFAYSPLAQAARTRRDNLMRSVEELSSQCESTRAMLTQLEADLSLAEAAGELDRASKAETGGARQPWRQSNTLRL